MRRRSVDAWRETFEKITEENETVRLGERKKKEKKKVSKRVLASATVKYLILGGRYNRDRRDEILPQCNHVQPGSSHVSLLPLRARRGFRDAAPNDTSEGMPFEQIKAPEPISPLQSARGYLEEVNKTLEAESCIIESRWILLLRVVSKSINK